MGGTNYANQPKNECAWRSYRTRTRIVRFVCVIRVTCDPRCVRVCPGSPGVFELESHTPRCPSAFVCFHRPPQLTDPSNNKAHRTLSTRNERTDRGAGQTTYHSPAACAGAITRSRHVTCACMRAPWRALGFPTFFTNHRSNGVPLSASFLPPRPPVSRMHPRMRPRHRAVRASGYMSAESGPPSPSAFPSQSAIALNPTYIGSILL